MDGSNLRQKTKKKSLKLLNDFIEKKRFFNMLQNGFGIWRQQTLKLRDILKRQLKKLKKKERYSIQKQMKRKLKLTFSLWYTQTKVTRFIQYNQTVILHTTFTSWKHMIQKLSRKKKIQMRILEWQYRRMNPVFTDWVCCFIRSLL